MRCLLLPGIYVSYCLLFTVALIPTTASKSKDRQIVGFKGVTGKGGLDIGKVLMLRKGS